ncbi:uncharacterized protein LOC130562529 isoform X2 [Triplophysa rosa]|uniref:MADF domain-containing protein n=1 Tax=Triplophysa rosa TaxID=992332 RepID=A0A9W7TTX5_TRIRA|nr:uncharacterized protein LOC130562529 isoform X2 [Triplophysa rosa]KAI7802736.1 hypothetical protein IRJ41_018340 [Triplophysa rosa]
MAKRKRDNGADTNRWDRVVEEKFVELWQQYSCLYDISSRDYHDKEIKDESWRTIAEAVQQPVVKVQTKASSLRTQYGKVLRIKQNGCSDKELTSRQKWLLKKLKFLQPFVIHRVSQITLDEFENDITDDDEEDQEIEEDVSESSTSHHTSRPSTPIPTPEASSSNYRQVTVNYPERPNNRKAKKKPREKSVDQIEMEKVKILKTMSETLLDASQDVDQTFAKQVVSEMKLIKDPLTKMRLRRNILMMLYDAHENEVSSASNPDPTINCVKCEPE